MAFRYHNERLRISMDEMLRRFKEVCEGKDISVVSLAKDKTGNYDDKKFKKLLKEIALADISEPQLMIMTDDETKALEDDAEYMTALLYVLIRAAQAGLGKVLVHNGNNGDCAPVSDDSFASVIRHASDEECIMFYGTSIAQKDRAKMFSDSMEVTAETVYTMLTGRYLPFPDPYRMKNKAAWDAYMKDKTDGEALSVKDIGAPDLPSDDYVYPDDDLYDSDDSYEPGDFYEPDEYSMMDMYSFYQEQEMEDYYHGDPQSDRDWHKYLEFDPEEGSYYLERQYGDLNDPKTKEIYDRDVTRLKLFFPEQHEYVRMYEHLVEITTTEHAGCEGGIERKIDEWLKENEKMIYSDEDGFISVFEMVCTAAKEARRFRRK
ncbi:MAG: hypothetical protein J5829_03635 [Lachnospiraceae bacterium]|nr:hypothetical protein [Lachnospiraceae bacterium]